MTRATWPQASIVFVIISIVLLIIVIIVLLFFIIVIINWLDMKGATRSSTTHLCINSCMFITPTIIFCKLSLIKQDGIGSSNTKTQNISMGELWSGQLADDGLDVNGPNHWRVCFCLWIWGVSRWKNLLPLMQVMYSCSHFGQIWKSQIKSNLKISLLTFLWGLVIF